VLALDGAATVQRSWAIGAEAAAMAEVGSTLVVGYRGGQLGLFTLDGTTTRVSFQQVPSSRPLVIVPGPLGTVAVGYTNGVFGLWSLRDGALLGRARLHGRIAHLRIEDQVLHAATDLGETASWDLTVFYEGYCSLLREIWAHVPVTWESGRPVERAPAPTHPCARP
jgi:hypothetical protein